MPLCQANTEDYREELAGQMQDLIQQNQRAIVEIKNTQFAQRECRESQEQLVRSQDVFGALQASRVMSLVFRKNQVILQQRIVIDFLRQQLASQKQKQPSSQRPVTSSEIQLLKEQIGMLTSQLENSNDQNKALELSNVELLREKFNLKTTLSQQQIQIDGKQSLSKQLRIVLKEKEEVEQQLKVVKGEMARLIDDNGRQQETITGLKCQLDDYIDTKRLLADKTMQCNDLLNSKRECEEHLKLLQTHGVQKEAVEQLQVYTACITREPGQLGSQLALSQSNPDAEKMLSENCKLIAQNREYIDTIQALRLKLTDDDEIKMKLADSEQKYETQCEIARQLEADIKTKAETIINLQQKLSENNDLKVQLADCQGQLEAFKIKTESFSKIKNASDEQIAVLSQKIDKLTEIQVRYSELQARDQGDAAAYPNLKLKKSDSQVKGKHNAQQAKQ